MDASRFWMCETVFKYPESLNRSRETVPSLALTTFHSTRRISSTARSKCWTCDCLLTVASQSHIFAYLHAAEVAVGQHKMSVHKKNTLSFPFLRCDVLFFTVTVQTRRSGTSTRSAGRET